MGKLTIGTLAGYMLGNFLKELTDEIAWYGGISVLLIGGLAWRGWISIHFNAIDKDLLGMWQAAKANAKEKGIAEKAQKFFLKTVPLMGGFATGFCWGMDIEMF